MESPTSNEIEQPTPETVSPTANWAKPTLKKGLKLRRKLRLSDEFGSRCIASPSEQPTLNRINPNSEELTASIEQIKSTVDASRHAHARVFNGLDCK